jgi:hypothetical protein
VSRAPPEGEATFADGRTVSLPLSCVADVAGLTAVADFDALAAATPGGLTPVRVGPGAALVTLGAVAYETVGDLEPYDEFAVVVPVTQRALDGVPLPENHFGGWVHWLPVTTDAGRRLGTDVWGYPKTLADVDITDDGGHRRCRVAVDGEHVLTLSVRRGFTLGTDVTASSYTELDGDLTRVPVGIRGQFGVRPLDGGVSVTLGSHERARELRDLGVGDRLLGRQVLGSFWGSDVRATVHRGERG